MEAPHQYRSIRVIALVIVVAALAAGVFAPLPGTVTYRDGNDCLGQALGGLFAMHDSRPAPCEPEFVADHTSPAGGPALYVLLVPTLLAGLFVAVRARPGWALLWSVGTWVLSIVTLVATFELELDIFSTTRTVTLWPAQALACSLLAVYGLQLVLVVTAIVARRRERPPAPPRAEAPELPRAIVR